MRKYLYKTESWIKIKLKPIKSSGFLHNVDYLVMH